jgi:tRNA nucleotidyltransferase/poly(A) polymerase
MRLPNQLAARFISLELAKCKISKCSIIQFTKLFCPCRWLYRLCTQARGSIHMVQLVIITPVRNKCCYSMDKFGLKILPDLHEHKKWKKKKSSERREVQKRAMIFPCKPHHNPSEAEDERKRTKKSKRRNYKQRREAKLTALMMTAQLRPETPSLQKLRNETLEKRKAHKERNTKRKQQKNEHTHSLSHSLTPRVLARAGGRSRNPKKLITF